MKTRVSESDPQTPAPPPTSDIQDLARQVNNWLRLETKCRLAAALTLRDLRTRIDAGEAGAIGWEQWCRQNIRRSFRDVQRLLALAEHPNPEIALEEERESNRASKKRSRTTVSRPPRLATLKDIQIAILKLHYANRMRLRDWLDDLHERAAPGWDDEART